MMGMSESPIMGHTDQREGLQETAGLLNASRKAGYFRLIFMEKSNPDCSVWIKTTFRLSNAERASVCFQSSSHRKGKLSLKEKMALKEQILPEAHLCPC